MNDRPILFASPMVRALLDGRKTQTRRLITPRSVTVDGYPASQMWGALDFSSPEVFVDKGGTDIFGPGPYLKVPAPKEDTRHRVRPIIRPGDRLYVRETWSGIHEDKDIPPGQRGVSPIWYWADGNPSHGDWERPRPGIHMPRWASRLTLTVKKVRMERLTSISETDARAEGIARINDEMWHWDAKHKGVGFHTAKSAFDALWGNINGPESWPSNPWVVTITFDVTKSNIDALKVAA